MKVANNSETRTVGPRGAHPDGVRWGNAALLTLPKSVCVLKELRFTLSVKSIGRYTYRTKMLQYPYYNSTSTLLRQCSSILSIFKIDPIACIRATRGLLYMFAEV